MKAKLMAFSLWFLCLGEIKFKVTWEQCLLTNMKEMQIENKAKPLLINLSYI